MLDATGQPRPHWRALLGGLEHEGRDDAPAHRGMVARQVRENGVTYNVYTDAKRRAAPVGPERAAADPAARGMERIEAAVIAARHLAQQASCSTSTASSACCAKACCRRP
jgi:uncharacterized circularly permuted ATP-grasp superfamily protein